MRTSTMFAALVAAVLALSAGTTYSQNFWEPIANIPAMRTVNAIAFQPGGRILIAGPDSGIYRSTDGGTTWTDVAPFYRTSIAGVFDMVTYPGGRIVVTAGNEWAAKTYITTDDGSTWQAAAHFDSLLSFAKGKSGGWLYGVGSFRYPAGIMYYSTDQGTTWGFKPVGGYIPCSVCVDSNDVVYAGSIDGYVLSSTDHGTNWSPVGSRLGSGVIKSLIAGQGNRIFALGGDTSMFRFDGSSWQTLQSVSVNRTSMAVNSVGMVFTGTNPANVYRSTDLGDHWTQINSGLSGNSVNRLAIDSAGYIYAGTAPGAGVPSLYRSVNSTTPPLPASIVLTSPSNSSTGVSASPTFSWGSLPEADAYELVVARDAAFTNISYDDSTITSASKQVTLLPATQYYWHVRGINVTGKGPYSSAWNFVTLVTPPTNLSPTPANSKITLSWTASTAAGIVKYRVYRGSGPGAVYLYDSTTAAPYVDLGVANGTTYYYKVTAVHGVYGESGFSNQVSSSPFNRPPVPASLSNVSLLSSGHSLTSTLTFSSAGSSDPDGTVDSTLWYVNSLRVATSSSLTFDFGPGTSRVTLVAVDNQDARDSSVAFVNRGAYVRVLGGPVTSGLSMVGDNVFYCIAAGDAVYRLDSTEATVYKLQVAGSSGSSCSIAYDSTVYISSSDNNLYAFSKNATSVWPALPLGGNTSATPTVDSILQRIYIGVSNNNFLGVNRLTGSALWNFFTSSPITNSAVISSDRRLVFATSDGTTYGVDLDANDLPTAPTWTTKLPDTSPTSPAIDKYGYFYFGTSGGNLYAVSMKRGESAAQLWNLHLGGQLLSAPVIDAYGTLYIGSTDSSFYAVNLASRSIAWELKSGGAIRYSAAISPGGNIYFDNDAGQLYCIGNDGGVRWSFNDPGDGLQVKGPILYNDGMVYAGAGAKSIIALYDGDGGASGAAKVSGVNLPVWSTFQGNNQRTGIQTVEIVAGLSDEADKVPTEFALYANFPNPFNPSTTIKYDIPKAANVSIVVYDVLGREVASLASGYRTAGRYDVSFDASRLTSGVYFYRIQAGSFVQVRKMVLMK